jgi:hypothetical protein
MHHRPRWIEGIIIGLTAAAAGCAVLLAAGALTGRGVAILGDASGANLPSLFLAATHVPSAVAYLIVHTALYLVAGVVAVALARLSDRIPQILCAVVLVLILSELAFVGSATETQQLGRIDHTTWQALLVAHLVADLVLVFAVFRVHPAIRRSLLTAYGE